MIRFEFDLSEQQEQYKKTKKKIKSGFYQNLQFYILPYMPEKFRNRVVFLPRVCEPEKIYKKQKAKIEKMKNDFESKKTDIEKKLKKYFPEIDGLEITITPKLYGSLGDYEINGQIIKICPRYDKSFNQACRLLITALINYHNFGGETLELKEKQWREKQKISEDIQTKIFGAKTTRTIVKILDSEFAGKLAEESKAYQEELGVKYKPAIDLSNLKLTKKQRLLFNLLLINKNKLITNDQIADSIWHESQEDKYSLYAISTLVKKLRKKLKDKTGKNLIHSQRGTGYIFYI